GAQGAVLPITAPWAVGDNRIGNESKGGGKGAWMMGPVGVGSGLGVSEAKSEVCFIAERLSGWKLFGGGGCGRV
ncbi:unnamed protein product, partial [marine sediment metagenome]